MADEESQVEEETSWWAFDAFADSDLPSMSIDEPLDWPDSLPWEEYSAGAAPDGWGQSAPLPPADLAFPDDADPDGPAEPVQVPLEDADLQWQPNGYDADATMAPTPLAGLGGGAPGPAPAGDGVADADAVQPLPERIWSFDGGGDHRGDQVAGLATLAAPLVYADNDGRGRGKWPRRLDIRRGNVAVVALISAVSLVLLGMFLSVRSRNDLPTDATASPPRTDQIATAGTRNTVPTTTAVVTTTVPGPVINIADLLPPAQGSTGGTTGGSTGAAGGTSSATTAPARSTAAPAGGGSTGAAQPAPQSTATTSAPEPPPETTTPTSPAPPPADDTTNSTNRPRTSTSVALPSIPDISVPNTGSTVPGGFNFPGFTIPRNDS